MNWKRRSKSLTQRIFLNKSLWNEYNKIIKTPEFKDYWESKRNFHKTGESHYVPQKVVIRDVRWPENWQMISFFHFTFYFLFIFLLFLFDCFTLLFCSYCLFFFVLFSFCFNLVHFHFLIFLIVFFFSFSFFLFHFVFWNETKCKPRGQELT